MNRSVHKHFKKNWEIAWWAGTKVHSSHSLSGESSWKKNPPTAMNVNRDHKLRARIVSFTSSRIPSEMLSQGSFLGRVGSKEPPAHKTRDAHKACVVGVSSRNRVHSTLDGFSHLKTHRQRWMFTATLLTFTFTKEIMMMQNLHMQQPYWYLKHVTRVQLFFTKMTGPPAGFRARC